MKKQIESIADLERKIASNEGPDIIELLDRLTSHYLKNGQVTRALQTSEDLLAIASDERNRARDPRVISEERAPHLSPNAFFRSALSCGLGLIACFICVFKVVPVAMTSLSEDLCAPSPSVLMRNFTLESRLPFSVACASVSVFLAPRYKAAFHSRAEALRFMDKNEEAIRDYNQAIQLDPENAACSYCGLGVSQETMGDLGNSARSFQMAFLQDPKHYPHVYFLANFLVFHDKAQAALPYLNKAIEMCSTSPETYEWRSSALQSKGDIAGALRDISKAIELSQKNDIYLYNRGALKGMLPTPDIQGMVEDCSAAIKLNDREAVYFYGRAWANSKMEKYDQVVADCTKAIELSPNLLEAYQVRSDAYMALGLSDLSEADSGKARSLSK